MKKQQLELSALMATEDFAAQIANELPMGITVGLSGELGSGKTTFIKALMRALGYQLPVSSPSYVLHHEYRLSDDRTVDHWDLYRLSGLPEELEAPCPSNHLRVIEWPERGFAIEGDLDIHITFAYLEEDPSSTRRAVTVSRR